MADMHEDSQGHTATFISRTEAENLISSETLKVLLPYFPRRKHCLSVCS